MLTILNLVTLCGKVFLLFQLQPKCRSQLSCWRVWCSLYNFYINIHNSPSHLEQNIF